ncbi:Dehydrogenase azaJ [Fusarium oxysporum f. sp. albedinis]|nr:Dehydrogenase azaJ [Fusarium oxysporum f. sp. albedinis]
MALLKEVTNILHNSSLMSLHARCLADPQTPKDLHDLTVTVITTNVGSKLVSGLRACRVKDLGSQSLVAAI